MKVSHKPATALAKATQQKDSNVKKAAQQNVKAAQSEMLNPTSLKSTGLGAAAAKAAVKAGTDSSSVKLSAKAQQIRKATDLAKQDTVDEKKVAHFQNLIDAGKYQIDSAKVADRLIDEHLKLPT